MPDKRYIIMLSEADRMVIRQDRTGNLIVRFSVQLEVLINGRWRKAIRFDSAHGKPHRHVFYPNGKEYKEDVAESNNNEAFTNAQVMLRKSWPEIHGRYESSLERMIK